MRHRYSYGPPPVRRPDAPVPLVSVEAERPAEEPYGLAAPAPAVLPLPDVADLVPAEHVPARLRRRAPHIRIELAEEGSMRLAQVRSRAADFARWRKRHRQLHRSHQGGTPVPA